jgi:ribosomal 50S subunit-associated protein YjgA (DUF615 family)
MLTQIKLRSQKDYIVKVSNTEPCSVLIAELAKHENIQGKRTQLFFAGKMMQDIQPIGNFMNEDGVVSVFLRNQPPA